MSRFKLTSTTIWIDLQIF